MFLNNFVFFLFIHLFIICDVLSVDPELTKITESGFMVCESIESNVLSILLDSL